MKRLLDWNSFNQYSQFSKANLVLENQLDDPNSKITRIKVSYAYQVLTGRYRFFAELAYKLKIVYTRHPEIQTAAVDGVHLFINPDFFAPLTEKQIVFILCHEVLHCALLHFSRMAGRDPQQWNIAGDYEINLMLADDGIISKAEIENDLQGLIDDKYKGMNAEQIYIEIASAPNPQQKPPSKEGKGKGPGGFPIPKGPEQPLSVGNVIRNERTGGYGVVTSINETTGEIDYDPISKEDAIKIVNA
jgi:hypothetical protein